MHQNTTIALALFLVILVAGYYFYSQKKTATAAATKNTPSTAVATPIPTSIPTSASTSAASSSSSSTPISNPAVPVCDKTKCNGIIDDYLRKNWAYDTSKFSECVGCDVVKYPNRLP